ncbi:MAG: SUMF1/EgtB/PvdO family nonheme iron enzyme [Acidobacteria bacterium]|nr:SUMF1/EgtB/PvdO family nonheme iron enzyme [Acidobacteriota bacterium]
MPTACLRIVCATAELRPGNCGRRVVRGGSWEDDAEYLRPGARYRIAADGRNGAQGFRVSRTLD